MIKFKNVLLILLFSQLIISCSKETRNRNKLAGVWDVEKYEQTWYSNNEIDSVIVKTDSLGWIGLYNNGGNSLDVVSPSSTFIPRSWIIENIYGFSEINWEADRGSGKTIGFYSFIDLQNYFVRYSINYKLSRKKMSWTYVQSVNDSIFYKEEIFLKRR